MRCVCVCVHGHARAYVRVRVHARAPARSLRAMHTSMICVNTHACICMSTSTSTRAPAPYPLFTPGGRAPARPGPVSAPARILHIYAYACVCTVLSAVHLHSVTCPPSRRSVVYRSVAGRAVGCFAVDCGPAVHRPVVCPASRCRPSPRPLSSCLRHVLFPMWSRCSAVPLTYTILRGLCARQNVAHCASVRTPLRDVSKQWINTRV